MVGPGSAPWSHPSLKGQNVNTIEKAAIIAPGNSTWNSKKPSLYALEEEFGKEGSITGGKRDLDSG